MTWGFLQQTEVFVGLSGGGEYTEVTKEKDQAKFCLCVSGIEIYKTKLNYISQWCQPVIKWPDAILNYYIFYLFFPCFPFVQETPFICNSCGTRLEMD